MSNTEPQSHSLARRLITPIACIAVTGLAVWGGLEMQKSLKENARIIAEREAQQADDTQANDAKTVARVARVGVVALMHGASEVVIATMDAKGDYVIEEVLKGNLRQQRVLRLDDPEIELSTGPRLLVMGRGNNGKPISQAGIIDLDAEANSGIEGIVRAALDGDEQVLAESLLSAIEHGGVNARLRSAIDLQKLDSVRHSLSQEQIARMTQVLSERDSLVREMPYLITVLASTGHSATAAPVLATLLARDTAWKHFESLGYAFRRPEMQTHAANVLAPFAGPEQPALTRRLATYVLARCEDESASNLLNVLAADADSDVASEALIGLAVLKDTSKLSDAQDTIMAGLGESVAAGPETDVEHIVAQRKLYRERRALNSGETFALMAAGYYIMQCGSASEQNWLKNRVNRIQDPLARDFIKHAISSSWAEFDRVW